MLTKHIHRTKLLLPHYVKQRSPLLKTDEHAAFSRGGDETRCGLKPNFVCSRTWNIKKNRKLFYTLLIFLSRSPFWRCLIYFCRLVQLWQGPCLTCGIRLENLTRVTCSFLPLLTFRSNSPVACGCSPLCSACCCCCWSGSAGSVWADPARGSPKTFFGYDDNKNILVIMVVRLMMVMIAKKKYCKWGWWWSWWWLSWISFSRSSKWVTCDIQGVFLLYIRIFKAKMKKSSSN